jgi:hypothetical protein
MNFSSLRGFRASAGWETYCSMIEIRFFRPDFTDNRSLARVGQHIDDYAETVARREFSLSNESTSSPAIR